MPPWLKMHCRGALEAGTAKTLMANDHIRHSTAISSAMSDVVIGHQGLSSAYLQCSPAVHFQPRRHQTTSSLHTFYVSHTFVQLDFFVDVTLHPKIVVCLY